MATRPATHCSSCWRADYGATKAYLTATAAGDKAGQEKATTDLLANADKIATFLSGANPNLPKEAVLGLLQAHGGHHISQIQQLKAKQYAQEAKTWAEMQAHMYVIADALTGAIAKQFPKSSENRNGRASMPGRVQ